jgi:hypothetical protein
MLHACFLFFPPLISSFLRVQAMVEDELVPKATGREAQIEKRKV